MEDLIRILSLIILILVILFSGVRRRKTQPRNAERRVEEPRVDGDDDIALPPFMQDFPFAAQPVEMKSEQDELEPDPVPVTKAQEPAAVQEPEQPVETPQPQPPPVSVVSPTKTRPVPATSLLDLSPRTFRQGIILSEILARPKTWRTRR